MAPRRSGTIRRTERCPAITPSHPHTGPPSQSNRRPAEAPRIEPGVDPHLRRRRAQREPATGRRDAGRPGAAGPSPSTAACCRPGRGCAAPNGRPVRDTGGHLVAADPRHIGSAKVVNVVWPARTDRGGVARPRPPRRARSPPPWPGRAGTTRRWCRTSAAASGSPVANLRRDARQHAVVVVRPCDELRRDAAAAAANGWRAGRARRPRAQATPRNSGTCAATGSSNEYRPASARRSATVAAIGLPSDPTANRVSARDGLARGGVGHTGYAVIRTPSRRMPRAAPGNRVAGRMRTQQGRQLTGSSR